MCIQNHIFLSKFCWNFSVLHCFTLFFTLCVLQHQHRSHAQKDFFARFLFLSMYLLLIYAYTNLTSITRGHVSGRLKGKVMEMCFSLVFPVNSQSQLSTDHAYVRGFYSPAHVSPSLQMNASLDIILIKVQSIFSSYACSSVSKWFFINLCFYSGLHPVEAPPS